MSLIVHNYLDERGGFMLHYLAHLEYLAAWGLDCCP